MNTGTGCKNSDKLFYNPFMEVRTDILFFVYGGSFIR